MKTFTHYAAALLFGLWAANASAENKTNPPSPAEQSAPASTQAVNSAAKIANPNAVNINSASAAELQDKLVGIGAKKAQAIVEYREKHGKFLHLEQLAEVSGIGKATLEKNRDRIILE